MTGLIFDIILVSIIIFCMFQAVKRGFISSLVRILGGILAALGAWAVSAVVATFVFMTFIRDGLIKAVAEKSSEILTSNDVVTTATDTLSKILKPIRAIIDISKFDEAVKQAAAVPTRFAETLVDTIFKEPMINLIRIIFFIIFFVLFLILVKWVSKFFKKVNKIPFLGTANKVLGGGLGIVEGIWYVFVIILIVKVFGGFSLFTQILNDSTIIRMFNQYNPIESILFIKL